MNVLTIDLEHDDIVATKQENDSEAADSDADNTDSSSSSSEDSDAELDAEDGAIDIDEENITQLTLRGLDLADEGISFLCNLQ